MRFNTIRVRLILLQVICFISVIQAQQVKILKSAGRVAVISAGTNQGFKKGNFLTVYRPLQTGWKPYTYVQITRIDTKLAKIELVPIAPQIRLEAGDRLLPSRPNQYSRKKLFQMNQSEFLLPVGNGTHRKQRINLGPTTGLFLPLWDMHEIFETTFSYGGILGYQFRPDLNINARFLYTVHDDDWSLWNLQLMGRRYAHDGFLFDLGYGILYPQIKKTRNISLGFCGGMGYTFPIAYDTWFEFGFIYSFYPQFITNKAQFLTMELRLIL